MSKKQWSTKNARIRIEWKDEELKALLSDKTGELVMKSAEKVVEEARNDSNLPTRTGKMRDSLTASVDPESTDVVKRARAHTEGVFYSRFQHDGTVKHSGYPFLRIALDKVRSWILEQATGMLKR